MRSRWEASLDVCPPASRVDSRRPLPATCLVRWPFEGARTSLDDGAGLPWKERCLRPVSAPPFSLHVFDIASGHARGPAG